MLFFQSSKVDLWNLLSVNLKLQDGFSNKLSDWHQITAAYRFHCRQFPVFKLTQIKVNFTVDAESVKTEDTFFFLRLYQLQLKMQRLSTSHLMVSTSALQSSTPQICSCSLCSSHTSGVLCLFLFLTFKFALHLFSHFVFVRSPSLAVSCLSYCTALKYT